MRGRQRVAVAAIVVLTGAGPAGSGVAAPAAAPPASPGGRTEPARGQLATAHLDPGDHGIALRHQGRSRSYIVHVPPQAGAGKRLPVVLNFHGGGGHAAAQKEYSHMDGVADREGFLAVYPDGSGRWGRRLLTWNAGTCCGYAQDNNVDDVGFVIELLDDLARRTPVDRARVYATGLSNGAMMAYRLAAEASDRIAAIAPVSGSMVVESFAPSRPVPILHFHSVDDPRALYQGGLGPPFPMTSRRVMHPGVEKMLARWVSFDGCPERPSVGPTLRGQGQDEGETATRYVYAPCHGGAEVALWKFTGSGHVWPGGTRGYLEHWLGRSTDILEANVEMWKFFVRWRLPGAGREARP